MFKFKNSIKVVSLVVLAFVFSIIFSNTNAATFNITGQGIQFGYDTSTPENGSTINTNTGVAAFYPSKINGTQAYCLDYLKRVPSNGTSLSEQRKLTTLEKAVLLEGYPNNNWGVSSNVAMAATQLAVWDVSSSGFSYSRIAQSGKYVRSDLHGMNQNVFNSAVGIAKQIVSAARRYSESDFSSSNSAKISIENSQVDKVIKGDYVYVGPLKVTTDSGNPINIKVNTEPSQLLIVPGVGATVSLNTVPSSGIVYLKAPLTYSGREAKVTFTTKSNTVNGYAYGNGSSGYQKIGIITQSSTSIEKTVTFRWTLKGKIILKKTSDADSAPLAGAKFTLYDSNKNAIQTKTTDSNGTIEFTELTYGTYYIKEDSAPSGFTILNTNFVTVVVDGTENVSFSNHKIKGRVSIKKYVEYTGLFSSKDPVGAGDATFTIYNSNGSVANVMSTDSNGVATSGYLPLGNYVLKETAVNGNYMILNSTIRIPFSITAADDNKTIVLDPVTNQGLTGSLELYKYAVDNNTQVPIQGAKFEIYMLKNADGGISESNLQLIDTITTNVGGKAYVTGLKDASYAYKEVSVPAGYKLDNTVKTFEVSKTNKEVKVSVKNDILYGKLIINKKSEETLKPLSGITFDIYASNKTTKVTTIITDANGKASVNLKYGTYYVKEVAAPSTVIMDTKERKVVIGDGEGAKLEYTLDITNKLIDLGIKLFKVDNLGAPISGVRFALYSDAEGKNQVATATTNASGLALFEKLKEGTYYYKELSAPDGYITTKISSMKPIVISYATQPIYEEKIVNEPILGQVRVHKIDEENNVIAGVEFDIKDSSGKVVGHLVTDEKGIAISDKLRKGNYTLVETKVPAGYILSKDVVTFTINKDGEVVEKEIINKYNKGLVKIKKVDSETKQFIDGAVFEIYKVNADGKNTLVDTIKKYSSDGIGTSQELKNGKYYIIETVAPKNAILDSTKYDFEITDEVKLFELTVENKIKKGQIALIKTDDAGNVIAGVKFDILDENKKVVETLTTDASGRATSSRLNLGVYYLKETYAPEIYVPIIDLIKVEIKEDNQVITLKNEIVNKKITGGIKIIKKDDASTPIAGVEFTIYKEGNNTPVSKITTNDQGIAIITDLVVGKYSFVETKVPDSIYINTETVSFEISQVGQLVEKTVINNRVTGKLVINKINSENGTGIEGVTFEIYGKDMNVLGVIYTNLDGIATTEDLKDKNGNKIVLYPGTYYFAETAAPSRFYFDTTVKSFTIAKGMEVANVNIENIPFKLPQTGGAISTDQMIVLIVSIISIVGYLFGNYMINRRRFA